jgi:hypothetical protein
VLTHESVYDLSACDVLDEGADVLYSAGSLCYRQSGISPWVYWGLILGAILLVRGLARNVQAHRETSSMDSQRLPLAASAACILLVSHEGDGVYATEADYVFYVATMVYCLCYLGYHVFFVVYGRALAQAQRAQQAQQAPQAQQAQRAQQAQQAPQAQSAPVAAPDQPPIFNLAAGVLQLTVSRLYTGAEAPYNPIILLILATRAITKLRQPSASHALTGLLDASYIALLCELGFTPDPAYLSALFACASLVSQLYFSRNSDSG